MSSNSPSSNSGNGTQLFFIGAAVIYFVPFAVITIDFHVLETNWFRAYMTNDVAYVLEIIYYPLIKLMQLLDIL